MLSPYLAGFHFCLAVGKVLVPSGNCMPANNFWDTGFKSPFKNIRKFGLINTITVLFNVVSVLPSSSYHLISAQNCEQLTTDRWGQQAAWKLLSWSGYRGRTRQVSVWCGLLLLSVHILMQLWWELKWIVIHKSLNPVYATVNSQF